MGRDRQHPVHSSGSPWDPRIFARDPGSIVKLAVVVQLVLLAVQFDPQMSTNGDDGTYYILGSAIAQGKGFRDIHLVGEPVHRGYPVLYPLYLSLSSFLCGTPLLPKATMGVMGALVTLSIFRLFRGCLPPPALIGLVALTAASGFLAEYSHILMSEVPYLLLTLLALLLYRRSAEQPSRPLLLWVAGIISVLPVHCRSVGLAFSVAWMVCSLLDKRYKPAVVHMALLAATLLLYRALTSWDTPYVHHFMQANSYFPDQGSISAQGLIDRIADNARVYGGTIIARSLFALPRDTPETVAGLLSVFSLIFAGIGWVRNLLGGTRIVGIYSAFFLAILGVWQTQWSSERFIVPILPFLYYFVVLGILTTASLPSLCRSATLSVRQILHALSVTVSPVPRATAALLAVATLLIAAPNVARQVSSPLHASSSSADWRNFYSCADWIRCSTPGNAVVMNRKQELFYLRSRRVGICYPLTHDVNKIMRSMEDNRVTHVVFDNFFWTGTTAAYLYPAIVSHPDRFRVVYALRDPDTFVLEFVAP